MKIEMFSVRSCPKKIRLLSRLWLALAFLLPMQVNAAANVTGSVPGKVYPPYVIEGETEIESRTVLQQDSNPGKDGQVKQRIGFGKSLTETWFGEVYLTGTRNNTQSFAVDGFELEAIVQLTEQGEYDADWGWIVELERNTRINEWEVASGVLVQRDWGRWSAIANFLAIYEYREQERGVLETRLATQLRYRYRRELEPAIELYSEDGVRAIGPVLMGTQRFGPGRQLHWEMGLIMALDGKTPDQSWKLLFEYEF